MILQVLDESVDKHWSDLRMDIVVAHAFNIEWSGSVLHRYDVVQSLRMMKGYNLIDRTVY